MVDCGLECPFDTEQYMTLPATINRVNAAVPHSVFLAVTCKIVQLQASDVICVNALSMK
jgi:hypothetical protein